jgi:formamidopyrimidine-DNA glycosylase
VAGRGNLTLVLLKNQIILYNTFMPELPEAEITKNKLQVLIDKKIKSFWTNLEKNLKVSSYSYTTKDISGRKIKQIKRWGKAILFYLSSKNKNEKNEKILGFHQRMSGRLMIKNQKEKPSKYVHFIIKFYSGQKLYFEDQRKFGIVWYGDKNQIFEDKYFKNLGKDFLELNWNEFFKIIKSKKGIIKALLLNQKNFSGIGNILADESLWLAKIHPQAKANNLTKAQIKKLFLDLKKIILKSIRLGGTSMRNWAHPDNQKGDFQNKTYVYGRQNQNCLRCKSKIIKIKSSSRGTYLCPKCQKIIKKP